MSNENLTKIRYSLAYILMHALRNLFDAIPAENSIIDNGFYYDFDCSYQVTKTDLEKIEREMDKIIKENLPIKKRVVTIDDGIKLLQKKGYKYTVELAKTFKKEGKKELNFYQQGDFIDICKNSCPKSISSFGKFKLTKISGVYWKKDEKNKMIQRVYGVVFENKKDLDNYLKTIEEAEKRDHRKLGKELGLFLIHPEVGLGLPMWLPKGAILWRTMEDFWYKEHLKNGYELVRSPHIGSRQLWEKSGHWNFYNDSMYPPMEIGRSLEEVQSGKKTKVKEECLIKPMNCPFHIVLYNSQLHSYRDLPMRWAECGTVYRYEKSGELSGLVRVRGFTQDDAHIICAKEQTEKELKKVLDFIIFIFKSFGFNDYKVYLSVRDPKVKKYIGTAKEWKFTEQILEKVAREKGLKCEKDIGGAVFYGPKLDFKIKDCLGREWQCSTLQYDFNLPEKFNMVFINKKGEEERPYMLHRALFGSFERFLGLLIEHYAGAFPVWLSPIQVRIISIGTVHKKYCYKLAEELKNYDIRVSVDDADETVGNKVRKAIKEKIPYTLIIGDKEVESKKLAIRERGSDKTRQVDKSIFIKEVIEKVKKKL